MIVLETQNSEFGFYRTIWMYVDPETAWDIAFKAVASATGHKGEAVRAYLDSKQGRYLANEVGNRIDEGFPLDQAIRMTVKRHMGIAAYLGKNAEGAQFSDTPHLVHAVSQASLA